MKKFIARSHAVPDINANHVVYLSGPMSGFENHNRNAFLAAEKILSERFGCRVLNPARQIDGMPYCYYIASALHDIRHADIVVLLDGFEASTGSNIEIECAIRDQKNIIELNELIG